MQNEALSTRIAAMFGAVAITAFMLASYFAPPAAATAGLLA